MRSVKADFAGCMLFLKTALHLKIPTDPKLLYAVSEGWFCWVYVVFEDCSTFEDTHWPKASLCGQWRLILLGVCCFWRLLYIWRYSSHSLWLTNIGEYHLSPVKWICVFEHSVMTNFKCACPVIQRGQGSGFLSEGSSWLNACMSEQRRFWRDCADAHARLNLRSSHRW